MRAQLFIITGVNGIGKSTIIPELKDKLNSINFVVHDFDERGVPNNTDSEWRKSELKHWLTIAEHNISKNLSTIVCGFMKISDIMYALENADSIKISVCVLDASPETISIRISSRYLTSESLIELERTTGKTLEKFASDNIWIASKFREEVKENAYYVLDTNEQSPYKVATNVIAWIDKQNT